EPANPLRGNHMKRLLILTILIAGCAHITSDIQPGDAEPALRRMAAEFEQAANAGDVNGMIAIYASDAVLMPPNAPEFRGRANIQQFWSGLLAAKPQVKLNPAKIDQSCDMATEIGTYQLTIGGNKDNGK